MDPIDRLKIERIRRFPHLATTAGVGPLRTDFIIVPRFGNFDHSRAPVVVNAPVPSAALDLQGGAGPAAAAAAPTAGPSDGESEATSEKLPAGKLEDLEKTFEKTIETQVKPAKAVLQVSSFTPGKQAAAKTDAEKILAEEGSGSTAKKRKTSPRNTTEGFRFK
jgi:hypothetical protein